MINRITKSVLLSILILALVLPNFFILAQDNQSSDNSSQEQSEKTAERQQLEEELKQLEEQISQYDKDISKTQAEKRTLQNQISTLKKKIEKLNLQIQQSGVMIKDLGIQIIDTESSIGKTSLQIEDSKAKLSNIIRTIYEEDQKSIIEVLLTEQELSDFFDHVVSLEALNSKNKELLKEIKNLKVSLEGHRQSLDEEKVSLESIVKIQTLQKKESETTKSEKDSYLKLTESQYQKMLQEKAATEKKATEIRARIFELIGVPQAPTFGEAYELAKQIEKSTGVRPAFLLAILTQESDVGRNVGQCYLKDEKTGAGVRAKTGAMQDRVMAPGSPYSKRNDVAVFLDITKELGRDPYNTPVSCPMSFGWGGAMGPAQFIPSTWILYEKEVKEITGSSDPWSIKDSFVAAALYLAKYGANKKTREAERKAALIYFSGSTNSAYSFYADSVLKIADKYEEDIKSIE